MKLIIALGVLVVLVLLWKWFTRAAQKSALKKLVDFDIDEQYIAENNKSSIAIDKKRKKVCFVDRRLETFIYNFSDIYKVELTQSADSKIKGSKTGALIGGAVAGKKGAAAGFIAGSSKSVKVKGIQLDIQVNDANRPNHCIDFLDTPVKYKGLIYNQAIKQAEYWKSIFEYIIENSKREQSKPPQAISGISDELLKLNELKEKGVITEEEFQQQKAKLLSAS